MRLNRSAARLRNRLAKLAAGLTPFGESVWPGVVNDLFVAHLSVYRSFFSRFVPGRRVLDAACGSGYGAACLLEAGAKSVLGVDLDSRAIRYARRHFRDSRLVFQQSDLETVEFASGGFDVITSSNTLEHLRDPGRWIERAASWLAPDGTLVVTVPPIFSGADLAVHAGIGYHRSNLSVRQWWELFESRGWAIRLFRHLYRGAVTGLDFSSPLRSAAVVEDFEFIEVELEEFLRSLSLSATFVLRRLDADVSERSAAHGL